MTPYEKAVEIMNWVRSKEDYYAAGWTEATANGKLEMSYKLIKENPDMTLEEFRKLTQTDYED